MTVSSLSLTDDERKMVFAPVHLLDEKFFCKKCTKAIDDLLTSPPDSHVIKPPTNGCGLAIVSS